MRVIRFEHEGALRFGRVVGEGRAALYDRAPWESGRPEGGEVPFEPSALTVPVTPSKIVCVGRNYRAHAAELGNEVPTAPLLFLKPPSALLASGGTIEWPEASERVDFEGEVGVVIGKRLRRVDAAEAEAGVFGLTCANDVTARDLQRADVQFTRGKGFDTFCPVGPHIETEPPPLDALMLETRVGGELRQRGSSAEMVFPNPASPLLHLPHHDPRARRSRAHRNAGGGWPTDPWAGGRGRDPGDWPFGDPSSESVSLLTPRPRGTRSFLSHRRCSGAERPIPIGFR